jgi:hypothetical protein
MSRGVPPRFMGLLVSLCCLHLLLIPARDSLDRQWGATTTELGPAPDRTRSRGRQPARPERGLPPWWFRSFERDPGPTRFPVTGLVRGFLGGVLRCQWHFTPGLQSAPPRRRTIGATDACRCFHILPPRAPEDRGIGPGRPLDSLATNHRGSIPVVGPSERSRTRLSRDLALAGTLQISKACLLPRRRLGSGAWNLAASRR